MIYSPVIYLQCDWHEALRERNGKAWVSLKNLGQQNAATIYGNITSADIEANNTVITSNNNDDNAGTFLVTKYHNQFIDVHHPGQNVQVKFLAPALTFTAGHSKSITSLDVSVGGGLGVSSSTDGTCHVWDTTTGTVRRQLSEHCGEVLCCKFFPSGVVIATAGLDTQIKIWSAEDGSCARTLKGSHTASVSDIGIVERGRNILSCSRDGTLLMWECGSASCIDTMTSSNGIINACCVFTAKSSDVIAGIFGENYENTGPKNPLEFGTENKLAVTALETGSSQLICLPSRTAVTLLHQHDSALNCCSVLPSRGEAALGSATGEVVFVQLDNINSTPLTFKSSNSAVLSLCPSHLFPHVYGWRITMEDAISSPARKNSLRSCWN